MQHYIVTKKERLAILIGERENLLPHIEEIEDWHDALRELATRSKHNPEPWITAGQLMALAEVAAAYHCRNHDYDGAYPYAMMARDFAWENPNDHFQIVTSERFLAEFLKSHREVERIKLGLDPRLLAHSST